MEFYESFCKVSGNLFFNATTNVCVGIWAFDSRLWCHTQEAPVSSLMPPRGCSWLTGGGAGPATRCPGRGGDLARLSVALCWSAPRSLRAPSCVRRACRVRVPSARRRPLSPHFLGRRTCPLHRPPNGQPYCGIAWELLASLDTSCACGGVVCGARGQRLPGHS